MKKYELLAAGMLLAATVIAVGMFQRWVVHDSSSPFSDQSGFEVMSIFTSPVIYQGAIGIGIISTFIFFHIGRPIYRQMLAASAAVVSLFLVILMGSTAYDVVSWGGIAMIGAGLWLVGIAAAVALVLSLLALASLWSENRN